MSWQKCSIQLVLGFPLALPIITHAVNVGDTYIQSGQNEPLNASINVSDIDPKTFSVKAATPEMYKQLGLSDDQAINVKFEPTSSNGGKIILTTEQPVATPYTDVVLNIENKGEKNLLPKTLLMPINGNQQVVTQPQNDNTVVARPKIKKTIANNAAVTLPQTTLTADISSTNVPLVVSKDTPPDLATTSALPVTPTPAATPAVVATPTPAAPTTPTTTAKPLSNHLVIQETRTIIPTGASSTAVTVPTLTPTTPVVDIKADKPITSTPITKAAKLVPKPVSHAKTVSKTSDEDDEDTTYIIQRNDSLWSIATKIAKRDGKNVHQVMQDIIDENPDAFENGDPARMIANTELDIPDYDSVPSQASIKAARRNRTHAVPARAPHPRTDAENTTHPTKHIAKSTSKKKSYKATHTNSKTTIHSSSHPKPTHRAQLDIVSASQSRGAAQGQHGSHSATTREANSQLLDEIKQRRTSTATQASRVNQLNGALSSSEQHLKIQNEKLAMLEKRLKELNSQ